MKKKILVLCMAGGIIASGIFIIKAQLKLGKPLVIKTNIDSYIYQSLNAGAQGLRNALVDLPKIPDLVGKMYQELAEKRIEVQEGITSLQESIDLLAPTKIEVEENDLILPTIKDPLIASITTLETTLPVLLSVLRQLDAAFASTIGERDEKINLLKEKIATASENINKKDFFWKKDLPERMDSLAGFLRGLSI